jgi:type VI secretion system protein ImpL
MTHEEAARVIGATFPQNQAASDSGAALATRFKTAWDRVYRCLAAARTELLARESDWARAGLLYEFPREFQKLKAPAVRFLAELCPPGSAGGPFLRGVYCSGARPIVIEDSAPPPAAAASTAAIPLATGMFGGNPAPRLHSSAAAQQAAVVSRKKIPQWLFLPHLFYDVLLRDAPES